MLGWLFGRKLSVSSRRPKRCVLKVEDLEGRLCLDGSITMNPVEYPGGMAVRMTGTADVTDPENYIAVFTGAVNAQVTLGGDGTFGVFQNADHLGPVYVSLENISVDNVDADTSTAPTDSSSSSSAGTEVDLTVPAPTLSVTSSEWGAGQTITIEGSASDPDLANTTIVIGGSCGGSGTVNPDGTFKVTGWANSLGVVTVEAEDIWGQYSPADDLPQIDAPSGLTMSVSYGSGKTVTLSGKVTDPDTADCTVMFSGVVNGSCSVDSNGDYSFLTSADALGDVSATVSDCWGQVGAAAASLTLSVDAPTVTIIAAQDDDGSWTFAGTVSGPDITSVTLTLSGLPSMEGVQTGINNDGDYALTITLGSDETGSAIATVVDAWGQQSDCVAIVVQTGVA
jgi:hypothetical protein